MTILRTRLAVIAGLLCLELLTLAVVYQLLTSMECQATAAQAACSLLRSFVARAVSVLAAFALLAWARPPALRRMLQSIEGNSRGRGWRLLHLAGIGLVFAPLVMAGGGDLSTIFHLALTPWLAGAVAASLGAVFWLAPPAAWLAWLREDRYAPLAVVAVAVVVPDLAQLAQPLWDWPVLTRATFTAVHLVLQGFGAAPVSSPGAYIIGVDDFFVEVGRACSGVEGFALVTGFSLLYAYLFRAQTRFPLFWFVVIPLGIVLSWGLNAVRIAALIAIGAHVSPELAVNGFHSYAGWMFFTLLALALLYGVQATPWLQLDQRPSAGKPLRDDWAAACILPFVAFMLAGVATSALSPQPDLAYPVKVFAILAALAAFRPALRGLDWAVDPVAVAAGVVVGFAWVVTRPAPGAGDVALASTVAGFGAIAFALWATARIVGTVLLVPIVEELFFRGYILARLDRGSPAARLVAIAVSSALFALLHDRWLVAAAAGVVFALVLLRGGRITDAVVAHACANLIVVSWAIASGDWGAI